MSVGLYAIVLLIVAPYIMRRERVKLTVTGLMLVGLWWIYGAGYLYFASKPGLVDHVMERCTLCLAVMWLGVICGIELMRALAPRAVMSQQVVLADWTGTLKLRQDELEQMCMLATYLIAIYLLTSFLLDGRIGQTLEYLVASTTSEKRVLRFRFSSGGYLFDLLIATLAPYLSFYLLAKWLATRRRSYRNAWIVLTTVLLACKFATLQKLPWVFFILQTGMVWVMWRRVVPNFGIWFGGLALSLLGLGMAAALAYPGYEIAKIADYLLYRIMYITNEGFYQTLYIYPEYLAHTQGYNIGLVNSLFGNGDAIPASISVAEFWGAVDATYNALFIADAWVDFGLVGVALFAVLVGVALKGADLFYFQRGKSAFCIAGVVGSMQGVLQLFSTSAATALLSGGLALVPALVSLMLSVDRSLLAGQRRQLAVNRKPG